MGSSGGIEEPIVARLKMVIKRFPRAAIDETDDASAYRARAVWEVDSVQLEPKRRNSGNQATKSRRVNV